MGNFQSKSKLVRPTLNSHMKHTLTKISNKMFIRGVIVWNIRDKKPVKRLSYNNKDIPTWE